MKIIRNIALLIIFQCSICVFANAQGASNKKASASHTFSLKLTKPAAAQLDMSSTANNYLSGTQTQTTPETNNTGTSASTFTVTDVATAAQDSVTTNDQQNLGTRTGVVAMPADKVQIITLSKA